MTPQEYQNGKFLISTDPARLDQDTIHDWIAHTYWAENIPKEIMFRALQNSLCFGIYEGEKQIGIARVISDLATFAYICDVFIDPTYRGQGLGKWLIQTIKAYPDLQGLRYWSLGTRDAHGLYQQFGFTPLNAPERHLEIRNPAIYTGLPS